MILTPISLRRLASNSHGSALLVHVEDETALSAGPTPRTSQQLLDVPRLHFNLEQHGKRHHNQVQRKSSSTLSHGSGRTEHDEAPFSAETLLKKEEGEEDEEQPEETDNEAQAGWVKRIRVILPHVVLATVVITYTLLGAAVFYAIESANEKAEKTQVAEKVQKLRNEYLDRMWNLSQNSAVTDEQFTEQGMMQLEVVLNEMLQAFEEGLTADAFENGTIEVTWTYPAAVLFSATVITTVGYGNLVPKTSVGRLFCIIYALLGIPLTLITIADIGKFVGSAITSAYERFLVVRDTVLSGIVAAFNRLHPRRYQSTQSNMIVRRRTRGSTSRAQSEDKFGTEEKRRASDAEKGGSGESDEISEQAETEVAVKREHCDQPEMGSAETEQNDEGEMEEEEDDDEDEEEEEMAEDEIPVAPSFILLIVVGYTAISSLLFSSWEDWPYLDSFYYCLITITTIGFGDLVPSDDSYTAFVLLFIFFGLILATMCIDMVGTHYISKIHYMGRKLQDAKAALTFIGGKAVNLKTWAKELKKMQRQYGMTDEQMKRLMENPEDYVQLVEAARMGVLQARAFWKAYEPKDASKMRYIDQNGGTVSECSPTSQQVTETPRFTYSDSSRRV